jgi:hypothetical protein
MCAKDFGVRIVRFCFLEFAHFIDQTIKQGKVYTVADPLQTTRNRSIRFTLSSGMRLPFPVSKNRHIRYMTETTPLESIIEYTLLM